jgi:alpha-glucosidase
MRESLPGSVTWLESPGDALFLSRGELICAINCGEDPVRLPPHGGILISSGEPDEVSLAPDTAVWLRPA